MAARIHILGASGSGTSTLARNLANRLASQVFDTDDFYWTPTDPPFTLPRDARDRLQLMETMFLSRPDWILAGPFIGWGDPVLSRVTHVIFLYVPTRQRLDRLAEREVRRHGRAVLPGGDMEGRCRAFLDWAGSYDHPNFDGRSLAQQENWLSKLTVPVIRLDAALPPERLTDTALAALDLDRAED